MTPVSISQESNRQESIKKELDELLSMAERSTASIDRLIDTRQETYLRSIGYILVTGILVLATGRAIVVGKEFGLGGAAPFVGLLVGLLTPYLVVAVVLQLRKLKRTESDLKLERHIHGRLVSLLDEQSRRMDREPLSLVERVTIDFRMKRLDRTTR